MSQRPATSSTKLHKDFSKKHSLLLTSITCLINSQAWLEDLTRGLIPFRKKEMKSKKGSCAGLVRFRAHLQTQTIGMISLIMRTAYLLQGSWVSFLITFLKHQNQILKLGMSYEHLLVGSMLYPSKGPFTSAWRRAPSQTHSHLILSCICSHFCTIRTFHAHAGFSL